MTHQLTFSICLSASLSLCISMPMKHHPLWILGPRRQLRWSSKVSYPNGAHAFWPNSSVPIVVEYSSAASRFAAVQHAGIVGISLAIWYLSHVTKSISICSDSTAEDNHILWSLWDGSNWPNLYIRGKWNTAHRILHRVFSCTGNINLLPFATRAPLKPRLLGRLGRKCMCQLNNMSACGLMPQRICHVVL